MAVPLVIPANAGTQPHKKNWVPAFAGMTMWLFVLLFAVPAAAQTFPPLTGRVVDQADLLRPEQEAELTAKSQALETATGRQFVVATVKSLERRNIEDYGYRLGRTWKIGDVKRDDGVILLVAPTEKKVRIETGYGARVFLTDAVSSLIIREAILPSFRKGDFAGGITAGADQIVRTMSLSPEAAQRQAAQAGAKTQKRQFSSGGFIPVIVVMIIFFSILSSVARRGRGRRFHSRRGRGGGGIDPWVVLWGLNAISQASRGGGGGWGGGGGDWGGGGGGGFGGGGGSFGGGGASGGW